MVTKSNRIAVFFRYTRYIGLSALVLSLGALHSSPTVISDNRVRSLDATPTLGRGYSVATNTFQSLCLTNLKTTTASFDFDFTFSELKTDKAETRTFEGTFVSQASYDWIKEVTRNKTTKTDTETLHNHHVLAKMIVNSYYSSLDESLSKLSDPAASLLSGGDLLGFFQSCGPYYVRSISRRSTFLTIFTYSTNNKTRDRAFEASLQNQIKRFSPGAGKPAQSSFKQKANRLSLRISTKAIGLKSNPKSTLIASDLKTFKNVLNEAFKATQSEFTGRIIGMEVVPWVENVHFQNLIRLRPIKVPGRLIYNYEQKIIMSENAEFFMQLLRVKRAMRNVYYKARLCRRYIDTNFRVPHEHKDEEKGKRPFKKRYRNAVLINRLDGSPMRLDALSKYLSRLRVVRLYRDIREFSQDTRICMDRLLPRIRRSNYLTMKECRSMEKRMAYTPDEIIDGYCLPTVASDSVEKREPGIKKTERPPVSR